VNPPANLVPILKIAPFDAAFVLVTVIVSVLVRVAAPQGTADKPDWNTTTPSDCLIPMLDPRKVGPAVTSIVAVWVAAL
jgi:hypothetical protein